MAAALRLQAAAMQSTGAGNELALRNQSQHSERATRTALDFKRGGNNDGPFDRQLIEVVEALQAVFVCAVHERMAGIRHGPGKGLTRVRVDGFHTKTMHITLFDEPLNGLLAGARGVRTIFAYVDI